MRDMNRRSKTWSPLCVSYRHRQFPLSPRSLQWKIQTETQRPGIQASHENCIALKPLPIAGGLHIEETFEISACMGVDRIIDEPAAAVFIDEGAVDTDRDKLALIETRESEIALCLPLARIQ
jgi:hypothetical protein